MCPRDRLRFASGPGGEEDIGMCVRVARDGGKGFRVTQKVIPCHIFFALELRDRVAAFTRLFYSKI